jgi:hypothetical protein
MIWGSEDAMADRAMPWTLDGNAASLRLGSFSAAVKIDQPELGIHGVAWGGAPIAAVEKWLAFTEAGPSSSRRLREIEDAYIRGRDLVTIYAETRDHPLRYVLYWRALDEAALCGAAAGLDVVASVQTSVLDAKPKAFLSSQSRVDEAWASAPPVRFWRNLSPRSLPDRALEKEERHRMASEVIADARAARDDAFLFELAESPWAYAEMIHPRDQMLSYAMVHEFSDVAMPAVRIAHPSHHILGLPLEKGVLLRARLRVLLMPRDNAGEIADRSREQFERAELPLTT